MTLCILISLFLQSGNIVKNNGEVVKLQDIQLFQEEGVATDFLNFEEHGQVRKISISRLKRINFKQVLGRTRGVTNWLAILVERDNSKHEVSLGLVEVKGLNQNGEEEVISINSINKISF